MRIFGSFQFLGRRSVPRTRAPLVAHLSTLDDTRRVVLIDISRTGVRVGGLKLPGVSEPVKFTAGDMRVFGEVIRAESGNCAIEFSTPIATEEVCKVRRLGCLAAE